MSVGHVYRKSFTVCGSEDFIQNVLKSDIPVIVNFHAEWCEPCLTLTPMLKKMVGDSPSVHLAIVDVEKNADLVHTFETQLNGLTMLAVHKEVPLTAEEVLNELDK
ncbi:hypothetical protein QTP88_015460 [Uroleucon formosanum]